MRLLRENEIECRIATITEKGVTLLLYKDARCDQNLLDETFGSLNWQRSHQIIDGNLYCTVSVWDESKKMWVSKQDVGTESYTEKEKGQASDSFKRACFNFGIGRELYTAPFVWVPASKCKIIQGEKLKCFDKFEVFKIGYDEKRSINELKIINSKSCVVVFHWIKDQGEKEAFEDHAIEPAKINAIEKKLKAEKIPVSYLCELYGVKTLEQLSDAKFVNITTNWEKIKAKYNERNNC